MFTFVPLYFFYPALGNACSNAALIYVKHLVFATVPRPYFIRQNKIILILRNKQTDGSTYSRPLACNKQTYM